MSHIHHEEHEHDEHEHEEHKDDGHYEWISLPLRITVYFIIFILIIIGIKLVYSLIYNYYISKLQGKVTLADINSKSNTVTNSSANNSTSSTSKKLGLSNIPPYFRVI